MRKDGQSSTQVPSVNRHCVTTLDDIVQLIRELTERDRDETRLSERQRACIDHWNKLLSRLPEDKVPLPSFPIWGDEIDSTYPFVDYTPYVATMKELGQCLNGHVTSTRRTREDILKLLPSYARAREIRFPKWKIDFIRQNREWFKQYRKYFPKNWVENLQKFPSSLRKLEWNCQGEKRNLWRHVLQFRPSGLRVKRYTTSPALVAMTSTQIPILGPKQRFLTRIEGLRLQGFPDSHRLPQSREKAFTALGNAVHVGVVEAIVKQLIVNS